MCVSGAEETKRAHPCFSVFSFLLSTHHRSVAVSFEGMALVLPIKRSMRKQSHFESMVMFIMAGICLLCWLVGALGYLAFGDGVQVSNEGALALKP